MWVSVVWWVWVWIDVGGCGWVEGVNKLILFSTGDHTFGVCWFGDSAKYVIKPSIIKAGF